MTQDFTLSAEQEVSQIKIDRPHVVILGAGASRAVCPKGDNGGIRLPLMSDFAEIVGVTSVLERWGLNPALNFEDIFSDLYERNETDKIVKLQTAIENYFSQLELPTNPTIYDHLILSLRGKDLIATFNWDPLLMQAHLRNGKTGLSLPKLVFLHGNVCVGCCDKDRTAGLAGNLCKKCREPYRMVPLLYPIKRKNYAKNLFIANQWKWLKWGLENAFMTTIFGYSGPKTDQEAIAAMENAWGDKYQRAMEQLSFITIQNEDDICKNWDAFIHTHHYDAPVVDFYDSWIAKHPRRTGEAWINQYFDIKFIDDNPLPKNADFPKLWKWFEQFKKPENRALTGSNRQAHA